MSFALFISCEQASLLVSKKLDQEISLFERLKLALHLLTCTGCAANEKKMYYLRRLFRIGSDKAQSIGIDENNRMSADFKRRLQEGLKKELV